MPLTRSAQTRQNLSSAVHRAEKLSKTGLLERAFTLAFRGLVYAQIWEDPLIDMEAMRIEPGQHIVAIASGGCNVMSYLVANPGKITALDLNGAHISLNKLKLCAARYLPDYETFHRFLASANDSASIGRLPQAILDRWACDEAACRAMTARDRSSIYGGFHLYGLKAAA